MSEPRTARGVPMTSVPPAQPPAAPETDVRLTEAERITLCTCRKSDNSPDRCKARLAAVERIVAERVRVVEGERDDLMALAVEDTRRRGEAIARAESAEAAHAALVKVLGEYFDFDVDPWDDHDAACPAPEDVWRLHRDLRALAGGAR